MSKDKELGGLDCFRLLAAFLVIAIHTDPFTSYSDSINYVFARVIARVAVPFFIMLTGYFGLPQLIDKKENCTNSIIRFVKKNAKLYLGAMLLYFPVNLYSHHLCNIGFLGEVRRIFFDGTFYHLWYFPAIIEGLLLTVCLYRFVPTVAAYVIVMLLYAIGLFGDSYYGFIKPDSMAYGVYSLLFQIFSYTRNGLFYVPVFLVMGMASRHIHKKRRMMYGYIGLPVFMICMVAEGLILQHGGSYNIPSTELSLNVLRKSKASI